MLEAWKVITVTRSPDLSAGPWLLEEPLFFNSFFSSKFVSSACLRSRLVAAGYTKLGHVLTSKVEVISQRTKVKSARMIRQFVAEMHGELKEHRDLMDNTEMIREWTEGLDYEFPSIIVSAAVENWEEDDHSLLMFKTPVLDCFELTGKKALYLTCVKVSNASFLTGVFSTKWRDFLGLDSSPKGCWRIL